MTVLLVEHSRYLASRLAQTFGKCGFDIEVMPNVRDALAAAAAIRFELVLLDLDVPEMNGLDFVRALRSRHDQTPIILLTSEEQSREAALQAGADDWLTKPLDLGNLVIRARQTRRGFPDGAMLSLANVVLDAGREQVIIDDRTRSFPANEVEVLKQLLSRHGRLIPKKILQRSVYGETLRKDGALEVLMHRLRKRLHAAGARVRIQTLRRLGYLIEAAG